METSNTDACFKVLKVGQDILQNTFFVHQSVLSEIFK